MAGQMPRLRKIEMPLATSVGPSRAAIVFEFVIIRSLQPDWFKRNVPGN
jgi:hypothetical protein